MTSKLPESLDQFFREAQQLVEVELRTLIAPPFGDAAIANLDDALSYSLGLDDAAASKGKRIRPLLCLLVARDLSPGHEYASALPFAAGIELMHNFCLVHDDIEDGDEWRRGRPAVWKQFGLPHAINVGDYLFTKIFAALLKAGGSRAEQCVRFFDLMYTTLDHTHRGQALDMNARKPGEAISAEEYMRLVTEKTGHYLAAPLLAGAMSAGADGRVLELLRKFGLAIGPMFQIRDDLIDLTHGKGREAVGSDIREGKRSFLVAHAAKHAPAVELKELVTILDLSRAETGTPEIERAIAIFRSCGAPDAAEAACDELRTDAFRALAELPSPLRENLGFVTDYLVERTA